MQKKIEFKDLLNQKKLFKGLIYEGGGVGNYSDDPISKLVKVGISGGFRKKSNKRYTQTAYVALYSTNSHLQWQDSFDEENSIFSYYGDNINPYKGIKNTKLGGNKYLEEIFITCTTKSGREFLGPIFIFQKFPTFKSKRSVKYIGIAVPGNHLNPNEKCLNEINHEFDGQLVKNYLAKFSILKEEIVNLAWLDDCINNNYNSLNAPLSWKIYIDQGLHAKIFI